MDDVVIINGIEFRAIAAVTNREQMIGLMHKPWPPPVMFFPYKSAGIRKFWMKNTVSPLDIVFCNKNRIISIIAGEPMSTAMVGPDEPCDLVIELPKGTAAKHGFYVGDIVQLKYSTGTAAKYLLTSQYGM